MVIALSMSLFACFPISKGVFVDISCDDFTNNNHIRSTVQVGIGNTITVTLCSNPTTGFQWSETAEISTSGILEQVNHEFVPPEQTGVTGGYGQEVWTFKALKQGTSTISIEYSRPWEGGEKGEWTYALTVTVE
jgi:predicted secreted protein